MTDNFKKIEDYIIEREIEMTDKTFESFSAYDDLFDKDKDRYYVIELMRRGKDNPNLPAANVHFKNYYINTISDIEKYKNEIKFLCDGLRMRAYFGVNYKSYKQVMLDTVAETARRVATHDYKKPYSIYESCSGKFCADKNKTWIIGVDKEDADKYGMSIENLTDFYTDIIENDCKPFSKIIKIIPTRSGKHIICHPFDVETFNKTLVINEMEPHSDNKHQIIKKNHLTLIYENL